jgi:Tfp pilus assembly protein PilF
LAEAKVGRCEEARALFRKALEADSRHLPAIQAWAQMEWGLGEVAKGRELYERGLKCAGRASLALLHVR